MAERAKGIKNVHFLHFFSTAHSIHLARNTIVATTVVANMIPCAIVSMVISSV